MRRRCLGIRCRTGLILVILTVCLLGLYFTYSSLTGSEGTHSHRHGSYPSLDKRKGLRFQAAKQRHQQSVAGPQQGQSAQSDWQRQRQTMISGALKFNPNLQKQILSFISELYPDNWATARETDEVALELKSLLIDIGLESNMSCKEIDSLQIGGSMAHSNKRYIERGRFEDYNRHEVTIKSQAFDVDTKIECMKKIYDPEHCSPMGNYKFMREILYLAILRHPNIVNMLGYCVRGDRISPEIRKKGLVLITEVGSPLQPGTLSNLPWSTKVMFAVQLSNLLEFLESSPIGNLALGKLHMQDFILVNNGYTLRLVDLDDVMPLEKICSSDSDCSVEGRSLGVQCKSGKCHGFTRAFNMHKLGTVMLDPILRNSPSSQAQHVDDLLNRLLNNEITAQDLGAALKKIQDEIGIPLQPAGQNWDGNSHQDRVVQPQDNPDLNRPSRNRQFLFGEAAAARPGNRPTGEYHRYDQSNYQGLYDFRCENSRVVWGCVLTAKSIQDSQNMCDSHPQCEAVVIYSSQPEADNLMTIILKNSSQSNPQRSAGTTLFIRREGAGRQPEAANADTKRENQEPDNQSEQNDNQNSYQNNQPKTTSKPPSASQPVSRDSCVKKSIRSHDEARKSRERRLMTHLGLKGMRESDWFQEIVTQTIAAYTGVTPATGSNSRGGKMVAKFLPSEGDQKITKALFMAEKGPEQFHSAHAIVYQTDRLLGLYHTPPSIVTNIPSDIVQKFSEDADFRNTFAPIIERDGSVKGLFTVPIPRVMKPEALTIKPLKSMVSEVKKFTRLMKMQFEYVFLWWLTKMAKGPDSHIGYKGHMIHFDADQAFQDLTTELTGYFFHCQFPNIVYKTLHCFRCQTVQGQQTTSAVCSLGQENKDHLEMSPPGSVSNAILVLRPSCYNPESVSGACYNYTIPVSYTTPQNKVPLDRDLGMF